MPVGICVTKKYIYTAHTDIPGDTPQINCINQDEGALDKVLKFFGNDAFVTHDVWENAKSTSMEGSCVGEYIPANDIWKAQLSVFKWDTPILHWYEDKDYAYWCFDCGDSKPYELAFVIKEWFIPTRAVPKPVTKANPFTIQHEPFVITFGTIIQKCLKVKRLKDINPDSVAIVIHRNEDDYSKPYNNVDNLYYSNTSPKLKAIYGVMVQTGVTVPRAILKASHGGENREKALPDNNKKYSQPTLF